MNDFKFCKMHGLGNDFVVIDAVNQSVALDTKTIQALADRKTGVGCDQVLLIGPSETADFSYTIYNADGSKALHCGNGARCVARFIHEQGLSSKTSFTLAMPTQTITASIKDYDHITIAMGKPEFAPPFELGLDNQTITVYPVTIGNPHAILIKAPQDLNSLGKALNTHANFSDGVNVTVVKTITDNTIYIQVYERGVGPTQACGSAATASAALVQQQKLSASPTVVVMPGGRCEVDWPNPSETLYLTGPATQVYAGTWHG